MKKLLVLIIIVVLAYLFLPRIIAQYKYPLENSKIILEESGKKKLKAEFTASLIYNESRFNPEAVSQQRAYGLMQLQIPTAQSLTGIKITKEELFKPKTNIGLGTKYIRKLNKRYDDQVLALIAYNLGPTEMDKRLKVGQTREELGLSYKFANKVIENQEIYSQLYPAELKTKNQSLNTYQLWKLIFTSEL